jgi:sugar (pentulose or hexulose) kinase
MELGTMQIVQVERTTACHSMDMATDNIAAACSSLVGESRDVGTSVGTLAQDEDTIQRLLSNAVSSIFVNALAMATRHLSRNTKTIEAAFEWGSR